MENRLKYVTRENDSIRVENQRLVGFYTVTFPDARSPDSDCRDSRRPDFSPAPYRFEIPNKIFPDTRVPEPYRFEIFTRSLKKSIDQPYNVSTFF